MLNLLHMIRLDYLSCVLTVLATVLIGKKLWQGWVVAGINSAVVCVIGIRTAQFGFVPANLLCIALYASNLVNWRPKKQNP
jgi:membrane-bound ClpP family serine protease